MHFERNIIFIEKPSENCCFKQNYLVPAVLGAPSSNILVTGGGTTRARRTATRAVATTGGGGEVALQSFRRNGGASLHIGGKDNGDEDKDDKVHFHCKTLINFWKRNSRPSSLKTPSVHSASPGIFGIELLKKQGTVMLRICEASYI